MFVDGEGEVDIPFMYTTNKHTRKRPIWDERLDQLRKFKEEYEHSEDKVTLNDPELEAFVLNQRWNYERFRKGMDKHKMTKERAEEWVDLNITFPLGKQKLKVFK